jgi:hypothetical protein
MEKFYILEDYMEPSSLVISTIQYLIGNPTMIQLLSAKKGVVTADQEEGLEEDPALVLRVHQAAASEIFIDPKFPKLEELLAIVEKHGKVLFAPFDGRGMQAEPLDLELRPECTPEDTEC